MSITFQRDPDQDYVQVIWQGTITDDDLLSAFGAYYESHCWKPDLHELFDLSDANLIPVTPSGLEKLADYVADRLKRCQIESRRSAAFVTNDHDYGVFRMYDAYTLNSPEEMAVFRDLDQAKAWLLENNIASNRVQVSSLSLLSCSGFEPVTQALKPFLEIASAI